MNIPAKINIEDGLEAEERANRLKALRNIAGMNRTDFCNSLKINIHTLKGWEHALHGGLSYKGATKVVEQLQKGGILCDLDWLFSGMGNLPVKIKTNDFKSKINQLPNFDEENLLINEELLLFSKHYYQTIAFVVNDDGMQPFYYPGDHVAGPVFSEENISLLVGKACIVRIESGELLVRKVRKSDKINLFNLQCINSETLQIEPFKYNVKLIEVAPIVFHRRKISCFSID